MTEAGQNVTEAGQEGGRTSPREVGQVRGRQDRTLRGQREGGPTRERDRTRENQDRRD